jgi:glycosyltransferase involved in cell wall biosynthesis
MPNWDYFYQQLGKHVDLDWRKLDSKEQRNLKKYFSNIDVTAYDRIFLELRFKQQLRQRHFIATLPNVIEYEHDATQNYKAGGKYQGAWSKYYSTLSTFRVISSGFYISKRLSHEGFDARFAPKGYNEAEIFSIDIDRDIELGFIGRTERAAYDKRRQFLDQCIAELGLQILRTNPGAEYNQTLNRIRYFLSADLGLEEYMGKNFEALAVGCVLCCYRQGNGEEAALGLIDMKNVVLYDDINELKEKLALLNNNPELTKSIASSGQLHARKQFSTEVLAKNVADTLLAPIKKHRKLTITDRILAAIGK